MCHLERSKSWHGTEPSGDGWLCHTSLRTVVNDDDDYLSL